MSFAPPGLKLWFYYPETGEVCELSVIASREVKDSDGDHVHEILVSDASGSIWIDVDRDVVNKGERAYFGYTLSKGWLDARKRFV